MPALRPWGLPREVLTAEQGFWTAARVPRVTTLAGDDEPRPAARGSRRRASIVTRALRQVAAFLFALVMLLAVSVPDTVEALERILDSRPYTTAATSVAR